MPKRNELIFVFSLLAIVLVSAIYITSQNKPGSKISLFGGIPEIVAHKIPILMYHYVEYNQDKRDYLRDQQNVPPHVLEQQILDLKNAGFTFITPKDLSKIVGKETNKKYVILSFDDGFKDFYTDAYPILKKQQVPAINYIVYNFLGGLDYMTEDMVTIIAKDPLIELGSHTLNHAYLPGIPKDIAEGEINLSKGFLEEKFGSEVVSFAYPFGNYDVTTINLVKKAGYESAVTVEYGNIVTENNLFTLKRIRPGHLTGQVLLNYINQ